MKHALVIGGGIAGLVSALALKKAGISAEVFEGRGPGQCGEGSFLTLGVNGLATLRILGIEPHRLGGFDTPRMALHLADGKQLCDFATAPAREDGLVAQTILRSDLYFTLREAASEAGIGVRYGKRLVHADPATGGVVAQFDDGLHATGDVLVGADGLRSRVRQLIDSRTRSPQYTGLLNTGGITRGVRLPDEAGTMKMFFGKRCFFAYVVREGGEVWWFANPAQHADPCLGASLVAESSSWRSRLTSLFTDEPYPAEQLIRATEDIPRPWPIYDLPRVARWYRDRMIIVGDAAHAVSPSSGQGASMAIEDGVQLARCLRDKPDPSIAFMAYESLRRERVERVVAQGRRNGSGKSPGPLGRAIRDHFLRWWFSRPQGRTLEDLQWLYDHHIAWDRAAP
jgi:2-polyprenyl-6-methoxyphenol hydroxylase-like FAD-dependent oxidoreductase